MFIKKIPSARRFLNLFVILPRMKKQHQIIISIGSNQGNRLQNLTNAISYIHKEIGSVIKTSQCYETPSWGFESNPFYNAILLLHSFKSADKILFQLLEIEQKMGRVRNNSIGYEARIIDLDIIAFDHDIIESESLIIPHPQLHKRNFVLLPLFEILPQWEHPKLKKNIEELIKVNNDQSECKPVSSLTSPLQTFLLKKSNYIAVEGNIGAGKTTLATKIAEDFNAKLVLERFADNPFLPKFYKDQTRYAFPLEMSFLADRYLQLADNISQFDLFKDFIIADYHLFKSLIFAKVTLQQDEYRLYKTLFDIVHKETPKPDLYVYLYQNTERLLNNIKERGRNYEQDIPSEYLEKINKGYLDYIQKQSNLNILVIDVTDLDFVKNQSDYLTILEQINLKLN